MFKQPFSFQGRIRRSEYFFGMLLCVAASGIAALLSHLLGTVGVILSVIIYVAIIWFALTQAIKRLHDLDKPIWWLVGFFIPIANFVFSLYLLFTDGTVGPNQFGLDPKNRMPYSAPQQTVNAAVNTEKAKVKE